MEVTNWDKWQTYRKDRGRPPWIKVHRSLLRNAKWNQLSDAEKGHLLSLWLVGSYHEGDIADDPEVLRRICGLETAPDLKRFVELGLLGDEK